jgi:hypothetical protein
LTAKELWKKAKIPRSTFYYVISLLLDRGFVEKGDKGYMITVFSKLGQTVDGALRQVKSLGDEMRANTECVKLADGGKIVRTKMQVVTLKKVMTSQELASECGKPYDAIRETAYAIARKRGLEVRRSNDGLECFQRKEQFRVTRYSEKGENAGRVEQ